MQNGSHLQICMKRNFDSCLKIRYDTLKFSMFVLEVMLLQCLPKKKIMGAGCIDDPLPNIVYMAILMPACIVWL